MHFIREHRVFSNPRVESTMSCPALVPESCSYLFLGHLKSEQTQGVRSASNSALWGEASPVQRILFPGVNSPLVYYKSPFQGVVSKAV